MKVHILAVRATEDPGIFQAIAAMEIRNGDLVAVVIERGREWVKLADLQGFLLPRGRDDIIAAGTLVDLSGWIKQGDNT